MKVTIYFQTPNVIDYALEDIKYEECVTLELDTETGKMEVLPCTTHK